MGTLHNIKCVDARILSSSKQFEWENTSNIGEDSYTFHDEFKFQPKEANEERKYTRRTPRHKGNIEFLSNGEDKLRKKKQRMHYISIVERVGMDPEIDSLQPTTSEEETGKDEFESNKRPKGTGKEDENESYLGREWGHSKPWPEEEEK